MRSQRVLSLAKKGKSSHCSRPTDYLVRHGSRSSWCVQGCGTIIPEHHRWEERAERSDEDGLSLRASRPRGARALVQISGSSAKFSRAGTSVATICSRFWLALSTCWDLVEDSRDMADFGIEQTRLRRPHWYQLQSDCVSPTTAVYYACQSRKSQVRSSSA